MRRNCAQSICLLCTVIMTIWILMFTKSTLGSEQALEISNRAQALLKSGNCEESIRLLEEGLNHCHGGEEGRICRAILYFNLGYAYQNKEDGDIAQKTAYLESAARYYQRALEEQPENVLIMNNLALLFNNLGYWEREAEVLRRAVEHAKQPDIYLIALGDLYLEDNKTNLALAAYSRAAEQNPTDETSRWRILNLYYVDPNADFDELFRYCIKLKDDKLLNLAKDGFEQVIRRSFRTNPELAELALLHWTEISANLGWITLESLRHLPSVEEWSSLALKELDALVRSPDEKIQLLLRWWRSDDLKSHIAASALATIASDLQAEGLTKRSARVYESALEIAPGFHRYKGALANKPIVSMKIALKLAGLYHKYSNLDPDGEKIEKLVSELFNEKALHYAKNDLAAIQRSHTVLGLIYAEKGQWTSGWRAANARYQLEHALLTARIRAKRDPMDYQPLPHLQSLLAERYSQLGEQAKACSTYLQAAAGYLELDDLTRTEQMLKAVSALPSVALEGESRKLVQLQEILDTRKSIPRLQQNSFSSQSINYYRNSDTYSWLFQPESQALDVSFMNRQRFKILSDMGNRALRLEAGREASQLQVKALEAIKVERVLTSMDDVIRLENIRTEILQDVSIKGSERILGTGTDLEQNKSFREGKIWRVATSAERRPIEVGIGEDLLIASEIGGLIGREMNLEGGDIRLQVYNGRVIIMPDQAESDAVVRTTQLIRSVEGVQDVEVKGDR